MDISKLLRRKPAEPPTCGACQAVINPREPHLVKDQCLAAWKQATANMVKSLVQSEEQGNEAKCLVWLLVKKRGGTVTVDRAELNAIPKDFRMTITDNPDGTVELMADRKDMVH